jgi:CDP-4-dehydro-6-deoxyglucose reductase
MHAVTTTGGKKFEAQAGELLLDAALRQSVVLDYSCRTGRCSTCKGRILNGFTEASQQELGLSDEERAAGWVLTCVRRVESNVEIDIEDLGDVSLPEAKTLPCRIQSLDRLSSDVLKIVLRLPPTSSLSFFPGQYIDVLGSEGLRRSYSIANAPRADKLIELHVREVAEGAMSRYWFEQAKVNDLLRLRGPLGTFFLREQAEKDLVFLATGTGIAPVKAILEGLEAQGESAQPRSISVYWGGRTPEDLYWSTASLSRPIRFTPVLSRADSDWPHARGHVQDALLADGPDLSRAVIYACGSDTMIHSAQALLHAAGLPKKNFHSDAFVCSAST